MHETRRIPTLAAVSLILGLALPSVAQEKFRETYETFAVAMGTSVPPVLPYNARTTLHINITRWSTEEEADELFAVLVEKGPKEMRSALSKQKETGFIRVMNQDVRASSFPSERLRYARQFEVNGKRRVVLGLDRYITMAEGQRRGRTRDFDVTLIVMDLDDEGRGEGQLAMGVRLNYDEERDGLVIENFATEPVRLTNIRRIR